MSIVHLEVKVVQSHTVVEVGHALIFQKKVKYFIFHLEVKVVQGHAVVEVGHVVVVGLAAHAVTTLVGVLEVRYGG